MLAFVDIQHEKLTQHPTQGPPHNTEFLQRTKNIESATGVRTLPVHYRAFSIDWMRRNDVHGFFISGNTPDWVEYDWENFKPLQEAFLSGEYPTLGFCGGHQLIGMTFGIEAGPLGPIQPGEVDLMPQYHPGMRKEKGYLPLQMCEPDHPLFNGFPDSGPVIMESHYWELKSVPDNFRLLASTPWCQVQVLQNTELPVYSIQGHPEAYTEQYPDGKQFIRNFALMTGLIRE